MNSLDYQSYLFGFILYIIWNILLFFQNANSLIINIIFGTISIFNAIFYLSHSKSRQLFYSTPSVLSRSPHVHRRNIVAGSRKSFRTIIADKLRSLANVPPKANLNRTLETLEIDIWERNSVSEGIFIFLFPSSILFSLFNSSPLCTLYFSIFQSLLTLILIWMIHFAIIDQKIIGEELYNTMNHALQPKVVQTSEHDYAVRVKKRTINYQNHMPRYGPGADLQNILPNPHMADLSESEYSDYDSNNQSPSFLSKLRNSSLFDED